MMGWPHRPPRHSSSMGCTTLEGTPQAFDGRVVSYIHTRCRCGEAFSAREASSRVHSVSQKQTTTRAPLLVLATGPCFSQVLLRSVFAVLRSLRQAAGCPSSGGRQPCPSSQSWLSALFRGEKKSVTAEFSRRNHLVL